MFQRGLGLRLRLLAVVSLAVLPALALIIFDAETARHAAADLATQSALQMVRVVVNFQHDLDRQARTLVSVLARDPAVHSGNRAACNGRMADLLFNAVNDADTFFNFVVIDLKGDIICAAREGTPGNMHVRDRDYFYRVLERKTVITGEYVFGKIIKAPVVPVAGPIMVGGEVKGVMLVTMNLAWLPKAMAPRLPSEARLRLYDGGGFLLAQVPGPAEAVGVSDTIFQRVVAGGKEGTFRGLDAAGDERLYAHARLPYGDHEFYVTIDLPAVNLFAEADAALRRGLAALAGVTLAMLVAAWAFGNSLILRPVAKVTGVVRLMAAGDLSARVRMDRQDEIGHLGEAFNDMADALERSASEAEHREAALREANAAKSNFLAMVSHEFRVPLAIIQAASQLLAIYTQADGEAQDEVAKIERAVRRLSDLIEDSLADERLDATTMLLKESEFDLRALLTELCEDKQPIARNRLLSVTGDPSAMIEADMTLLRIAFSNLIDNALKFSPPESPVEIGVFRQSGGVGVSIADQGPGIAPEDQGHIFEKYFRSTKTDRVRGAGLGLYIVRRVIDLHAGRIEVDSRPGAGATFRVWLPRHAAPAAPPPPAASRFIGLGDLE